MEAGEQLWSCGIPCVVLMLWPRRVHHSALPPEYVLFVCQPQLKLSCNPLFCRSTAMCSTCPVTSLCWLFRPNPPLVLYHIYAGAQRRLPPAPATSSAVFSAPTSAGALFHTQVHGDVFRPPRYLEVLAALVGTGVQLALLVLSVILITIAGERQRSPLPALSRCQVLV